MRPLKFDISKSPRCCITLYGVHRHGRLWLFEFLAADRGYAVVKDYDPNKRLYHVWFFYNEGGLLHETWMRPNEITPIEHGKCPG